MSRKADQSTIKFTVSLARRRWYEWLAWVVWGLLLVFAAQNASASIAENEPMASTVFLLSGGVLLALGLIVHILRRNLRARS